MDENVKPKLKPSNPSYNKYTIAGINELIKQNIFDIESFFKLLDAIQNISYNVKPVEITNKNIERYERAENKRNNGTSTHCIVDNIEIKIN